MSSFKTNITCELEDLEMFHGQVLVKPFSNEQTTKGTLKLYLGTDRVDSASTRKDYTEVCGEVVKCGAYRMLSWDNEVELQKGDTVWFDNRCSTKMNRKELIVNGESYLLLEYKYCIIAKRGEQLICLNGFLFVEPDKEIIKSNNLIVDFAVKINSLEFGTIRYIGKRNKGYHNNINSELEHTWEDTEVELKEGDRVIMLPFNNTIVESWATERLKGGSTYYRMQRKDLVGIIRGEKKTDVELFGNFVMVKMDNVRKKGLIIIEQKNADCDGVVPEYSMETHNSRFGEVVACGNGTQYQKMELSKGDRVMLLDGKRKMEWEWEFIPVSRLIEFSESGFNYCIIRQLDCCKLM